MVVLRLCALAPLLAFTVATPLVSGKRSIHPGLVSENPGLLHYLKKFDPSKLKLTPGPGLPTLEELGWTMKDFFDPEWRAAHGLPDPRTPESRRSSPLEGREISGYCSADMGYDKYGNVAGGNCCADYPLALGTQLCEVSTYTTNCACTSRGHDTVGTGYPRPGLKYASSYCQDVGTTIHDIVATCPPIRACADYSIIDSCGTGGSNTAYGNGDYVIFLTGDILG